MREFVDAAGRRYQLEITVETLRRVKLATGRNLAALFDAGWRMLAELAADPAEAAEVLAAALEPDALTSRKMDDLAFRRSLHGDAVEGALDALVEAVIDFFPSRRQTILRAGWTTAKTADEAAMAEAATRLRTAPNPSTATESTDSPSSWPDSAASNPGASASAS